MHVTKSQLIESVAKRLPNLPAKDVETIVNTVFDAMGRALQSQERIEIRGFGIFGIKVRRPKLGRNPKTGAKVQVPERRIPFFIVGKDLKERLNRPARVEAVSSASSESSAPVAMVAAPRETL